MINYRLFIFITYSSWFQELVSLFLLLNVGKSVVWGMIGRARIMK